MKTTPNERVKQLRTDMALSREKFAQDVGISASLLIKIELGEMDISYKVLEKISTVYKVPIEWIEYGKGEYKFERLSKTGQFDPATDTLYKELKEQIAFYRTIISNMTGNKASFLRAANLTGSRKKLRLAVSR